MVQLYRFTQFLISLILVFWLGTVSSLAQSQVSQLCSLDNFQASNGHSIYLDNLPGASSPRFVFDSQGGNLTIFNDGTANLTGRVQHESQPNLQWDVNIWLVNERDFATWTALGRGVKVELAPQSVVTANQQDWLFYELDDTRSTLIGVGGTFYDGDTLDLSHRPSNFDYGFQMGIGANAKNAMDGLSGWFFYSGAYTGIGDVNVNRDCSAPTCDVEITDVTTTCINDSTFNVSVSFTGTGNQFEISDNQGRSPLSGLSAGTYMFSSYSNNTNVEIIVSDMSIAACADTADVVSNDCTPAPVCDVAIDSLSSTCLNDTTFEVSVYVSGTGNYTISDDQGSATQNGVGGVFVFGPYANNTPVSFTANDASIANCSDNAGPISNDCAPPPPVCDVAIDSIYSVCITDSTFEVSVIVSGAGTLTVRDNQGFPVQTGPAGTYTFGPYRNNLSNILIVVLNPDIANCQESLIAPALDCSPPPPVCDVALDSLDSNCLTDSTFEVSFILGGTGNYTVSDNQGMSQNGAAGSYTFGPYLNNVSVSFTATDDSDSTCQASIGPITADCAPDTCAVTITDLVAECASDTSFAVMVTFTGIGNNFSISDNLGSTPMTGLGPGTYMFGDYFNSTDVFITVSDSSFAGCTSTLGPVTADCTPVPVCDVSIDTAYTECINDSTFEVVVTFQGTGSLFQIFDNLGSPGVTNLAAGTYRFGVYPNGSQVQVTVLDFAIFNCFETTPPLTNTCDTTGTGLFTGITNFVSSISGKNVDLSWESKLLDNGTYYEIEREDGAGEFTTIGMRMLSEMDLFENKYYFTDYAIEANKYFSYRIKQVKPDGEISYSALIKTIRLDQNELLIGEVYPNPSNGITRIKMNAGSPHRVSCELLDAKGALVSDSVINTVVGSQELVIPSNKLRPGMYLVRLTLENNKVFVRKLIITE
ncbi:MAG: T9SS type A sorting domain-containing protein [Bacteroidia bacterium]|nr:T9SS type A sorting domain-containing protein [Bacteroidia bacterium]